MNSHLHCVALAALVWAAVSPSRADERPASPAKPSYSLKREIRNVRDPEKGTTKVAITIAEKTIDLKALDAELAMLVRAARAFGIASRDIRFIMRAESDVPVGSLQHIIEDAQKNGFEMFAIEAPRGTPTGSARSADDKSKAKCHEKRRHTKDAHPRG